MKGKIAFVLGAAVGYVLGTRAGRERYEQIKRGAKRVWQTEPVQRGVGAMRDAVDERAEDLKAFVFRAGGDVFNNLAKKQAEKSNADSSSSTQSAAAKPASSQTKKKSTASSSKSAASKSGASKSSASKSSASTNNKADS